MPRKPKSASTTNSLVSVPDGLTFGDTFAVTWASDQTGDLLVKAECFSIAATEGPFAPAVDVSVYAWAEPAVTSPQSAPEFELGPTPRWSGGPARGRVYLIRRDTPDGSVLTTLAESPFSVGP